MRRALIARAVALAALGLVSSAPASRLPPLVPAEVVTDVHTALGREFRASYRARSRGAEAIHHCRYASRTRAVCGVAWRYGKYDYRGPVTIWLTKGGGPVEWNYSFTIRRLDHDCLQGGRARSGCTKTFVVR